MKRKLAISLTSIFLLVLLCTTFIYFLFTTSAGLNQTFQLIQKFVPGKLAVKKLEGCLIGPITFTELTYQDPDVDIIIHKLQLDWTLQHLLQKQLIIKHIAIDQPKILIKPSDTDNELDWRSFLKHIRVDALFIKQGLIQYRDNLLKIEGIVDQQWHLNWQLIIPNFKNLSPNLHGNLDLQGKINGAHDTPLILLPFNNQTLVGESWALRHLQGLIKLSFNPIQLTAKINNLQIDLPNFKNLTGQFNADIHMHDVLTAPQFNGVISLHNARGELPSLGLLLRNINIQAVLDNTTIKWLGNLRSGAGNLALTGVTNLKQKHLTTLLNLQGKNLTVSDLKNYKITATPNLQIKVDTQRLDMNGDIFLPQARINLGGTEETVITLSNDVVFVDQKSNTASTMLPIYSKISLRLGNEIKLYYQGLRTLLNGNLTIIEEPDHPTRANGQINLRKGRYKYYSDTLTIKEDSQLLFQGGPIDNPVLNITATKSVKLIPQTTNLANNISSTNNTSSSFFAALTQPLQSVQMLVGIYVQGHAQNPQLKLFSDPAILSQTDILSFLITGQPSSQLSSASTQLLFNAVSNLNSKSSDLKNLIKSVQQGIGLDQLAVQDTSYINPATNTYTSNTSLVLGKALSPRLYINYSIGLLEPVNVLQINYLLTKYFSLQSANSTLANSIDLLFKIEK